MKSTIGIKVKLPDENKIVEILENEIRGMPYT